MRRVIKQWWLIALCGLVACVAAYVASSSRTEKYEATAVIEVGSIDLISVFLSDEVAITDTDPERQTASAVQLFSLPNVRDRAAKALADTGLSPDAIGTAVRIESTPDSSVLRVIGRADDPEIAKRLANSMTDAFVQQRKVFVRDKLVQAKSQVRKQFNALSAEDQASETGQLLQDRLRQVGVVGALSDGNVSIVQGARTPTAAVSPKPKRDAMLGLIAGLLLGTGIALLRARLDDRIRETEELTELWDLPIVGLVPQTKTLKESGRTLPDAAALEALSLARTNLRYLHVGGRVKILAVTSALESEGKSTLTWNLGIASAMAGSKVLVVEGDMRRPVISGRLGLSGVGLSEVLAGLESVDQAIHHVAVAGGDGGKPFNVDVIPAGLVPPSPVALLEGPQTKSLFAELRERYDVVLIDTPPATVVADALSIVDEIDGVLIVSRLGTVRRGALRRLREILTGVNAPVIGQIVNSDVAAKGYGYYSSYTAGSRKAAKEPAAATR